MRRGVAELLIVFLGIIGALWADELRRGWADRDLERTYLGALRVDIAEDIVRLESVLRSAEGHAESARRVWDTVSLGNGTDIDPGRLAYDIQFAGFGYFFYPSNPTYRDLLSTGGLGLIEDLELRHAVVGYYEAVSQMRQFYVPWTAVMEAYRPHVNALLPPADYAAIVQSFGREQGRDSTLLPPAQLDVARTLGNLDNAPFLNSLLDVMESAEQQEGSFIGLLATAEALSRRLEGGLR